MKIFIVDYGVGNIGSLVNMLRRITDAQVELVKELSAVQTGDKVILPGVGNFGFAMRKLNELDLSNALRNLAKNPGVQMLGICLGAQLLLDSSEEAKEPGLGIVAGHCKRFDKSQLPSELRVPHMGWADVTWNEHPLCFDLAIDTRYYFVHSYHMIPESAENELFYAEHGDRYCAGIVRDNVIGVQFHPEKSHRFGMELLKSFVNWKIA